MSAAIERRTFDQDAAARARRVLAGTQTGQYTKRSMARDILAMSALLEAHRREFRFVSVEYALASSGERVLADFEEEVLRESEADRA